MKRILYVVIFLLSATTAAYLHYVALGHSSWSRSTNFIVSFGAMFALGIVFAIAEERILWRGFFGFGGREMTDPLLYRRVAPPPIAMGVMAGLLVFLVWS